MLRNEDARQDVVRRLRAPFDPQDPPVIDHDTFELRHKDDFDQVYDLDDPRPYYQGLRPADYRMPGVVAAWLRAKGPAIAAARSRSERLRMLDFACGYGAVGALLRHRITMQDLYRHYAGGWRRADERINWKRDRNTFTPLARHDQGYEIGGLDIASVALEYARYVGFIDTGFAEDISAASPGSELRRFLAGVDVIVECGSLGPLLTGAMERLVHATRDTSRPWFLYCPRPDVDWERLSTLWDDAGYEATVCVRAPVRYRKALSDYERDQMLQLSAQLGYRPEEVIESEYILVEMTLARPRPDAGGPDIESFLFSDDAR